MAPGFLRAMGVPVLRGREFTETDAADAPPVALIDKALADACFAGRDPIGQRLGDLGPTGRAAEIVGVVGDTRYRSMRVPAAPMVYVPHAQFYMPRMTLVVRTTGPPLTLRSTVTGAVRALDPDLPLFQVMTMDERLRASLAQERLLAWLLGIFAGLALFLAVAGLYGVVAYGAALRTREFGIRIALGAQAAHVRRLVLAQGLALTAVGLALGLILAQPAGAAIRALLFEGPPRDPPTTAAVVVLLAAAAALAGQWPARRAARIEPSTALREH